MSISSAFKKRLPEHIVLLTARTPSMRRPVGVKIHFCFLLPCVCSHSAEPPLSPSFHSHSLFRRSNAMSDPDFCIYKDVIVQWPANQIEIYGYPVEVFPPTDFRTATAIDGCIVIVGGLG